MTSSEFIELCEKRDIYAPIALENEKIIEALKARDDELVNKLLDSEF